MTIENPDWRPKDGLTPAWDSSLELEFDVGFDRPIFVEGKKPQPKEKPLKLPPIRTPEVSKKHIEKDGKR